ncbi:MAG: helix-turn-helix domain-containing protein [Bifidobacterium crudilactis]|nr:helix-turn-helix domain-containing protein [Bifidobacterium crudilactis]
MTLTQTIPSAVGDTLSSVRREHGLTLDQIAYAARNHGASWSASSVSNIERGQASLTLQNLILLALAINDLTAQQLSLADLLGGSELLVLGGETASAVSRSWIDDVLKGAVVRRCPYDSDDSPATGAFMEERNQALEEEVDRLMDERGSGHLSDDEMRAAVDQHLEDSLMPPEPRMPLRSDRTVAGSLAEARAAKKLGISVAALREAAIDLWARPLEEESSRRAGPGSSPQARGRITRTLIDEIRRREG